MMADKIERPISPDPITGFARIGRHQAFLIDPDLEMIQQISVVTLDKEGNSIADKIAADDKLSPERKQQLMQQHGNVLVTRNTRGVLVDSVTGRIATENTQNTVAQSQFFQEISIGTLKAMGMEITNETKFLQILYQFLALEIENIDKRGDL